MFFSGKILDGNGVVLVEMERGLVRVCFKLELLGIVFGLVMEEYMCKRIERKREIKDSF